MQLKLILLALCLLFAMPTLNATNDKYVSGDVTFDPQGLGPWYDGVNAVLDSVIGKVAFPPDLISVNDHAIEIADDVMAILPDVLKHYVGLLIIIIVGILLAIITPIIGLCFCACRCCGNCGGGKSQPYNKEKESCCGPFLLTTFLLVICAALLFGAVVTFVTNDRLEEGIKNAPETVKGVVNDATLFLQNTTGDFQSLLTDHQFSELSKDVLKKIEESPETISKELEEKSKAVSINELLNVAEKLPEIQSDLEEMGTLTTELENDIKTVSNTLNKVKQDLSNPLGDCGKPCETIKQQTNDLVIGIDVYTLPDTGNVVNDLDSVKDLKNKVDQGVNSFGNIKTNFQNAVDDNIGSIRTSIDEADEEIKKQTDSLMSSLDGLRETISNQTENALDTADQYIDEYSGYRYYVGLVLCLILLIVAICVASGLLCGTFGKRKHNRNDCGNKDIGGALLMCAVGVLFITTLVFAIAVLVQFIAGLLVHRAVCVPLQTRDDQIFNLINDLVDLNAILNANNADFSLKEIIDNCHKDKSVYKVFKLENVLGQDITDLDQYLNIDDSLKELTDQFEMPSNVEVMNPDIKNDLNKLKDSELSTFPFSDYTNELSKDITKVDLEEFANQLDQVSQNLPHDVKAAIKLQADILRNCQNDNIKPMITKTEKLKATAGNLEKSIKFNKASFADAITDVTNELELTQKFIDEYASAFVKDTITKFGNDITGTIKAYLDNVVDEIKNNIGKCGPLANAYDATLITICNNVLDPFNGFWAGLGWSVLLFIPCIIFCVKLTTHYRKYDPGFQV